MGITNSIKRFLGFGEADDEDGLLSDSGEPSVAEVSVSADNSAEISSATVLPPMPEIDESRCAAIFDSVVRTFNDSLPAFFQQSVDLEKQKAYLYESLSRDLKDYIALISSQTAEYARAEVKAQSDANVSEMTRLRNETQRLEQQRTSIREQQLSADRQRRALSERVKDLEAQVSVLEAEREQFQLENMSLVNKLKVADVRPGIIDELNEEISRLKAALEADGRPAEDQTALIDSLRKELEQKEEANKMTASMVTEMQHELVNERKAHEKTAKKLEEANLLVEEIEEVQKQMTKVEELISARDEKIASLKNTNRDLRRQVAKLKEAAARSRVETSPSLFGDPMETESGQNTLSDTPASYGEPKADTERQPAPSQSRPITASDLEDIDDEFSGAGWLVSVPPEGGGLKTELTDAEFGYHEPPKKNRTKENDAQLSLF